jgi:hypothetical protein
MGLFSNKDVEQFFCSTYWLQNYRRGSLGDALAHRFIWRNFFQASLDNLVTSPRSPVLTEQTNQKRRLIDNLHGRSVFCWVSYRDSPNMSLAYFSDNQKVSESAGISVAWLTFVLCFFSDFAFILLTLSSKKFCTTATKSVPRYEDEDLGDRCHSRIDCPSGNVIYRRAHTSAVPFLPKEIIGCYCNRNMFPHPPSPHLIGPWKKMFSTYRW